MKIILVVSLSLPNLTDTTVNPHVNLSLLWKLSTELPLYYRVIWSRDKIKMSTYSRKWLKMHSNAKYENIYNYYLNNFNDNVAAYCHLLNKKEIWFSTICTNKAVFGIRNLKKFICGSVRVGCFTNNFLDSSSRRSLERCRWTHWNSGWS